MVKRDSDRLSHRHMVMHQIRIGHRLGPRALSILKLRMLGKYLFGVFEGNKNNSKDDEAQMTSQNLAEHHIASSTRFKGVYWQITYLWSYQIQQPERKTGFTPG